MKENQKNFIAFTLSEMMIVLLIISVISAATLPAITQRNEIKPANAGSVWWYDNKYTKGYFYANDANTDVLIGYNIKGYIPANKNTVASYFGYSALKLGRSAPSDNFLYASQGRSDIAFFNKDRIYQGKIAADTRGNIAMGRLTSNNNQSALNSYGNLFIGSYAGYSVATSSEQKYNTIVGTYALSNNGMYTYAGTNNVIIAPKATGTSPQDRNVIIGYGATFNSITSTLYDKKYNNTVSIGAFSSSNAIYAQSNVNVGFYAGARPTQNTADNVGNGYNNFVNIGHYAGYNAGTGHNSYSNINIGNFSGSNNNTTHGNTLNIGSYAGYLSKSYNTVNIGKYAAYSQTFDNIGYGSVNIGAYSAMHSNINSPMDNVNIGYYAGYASINNRNVNIGNYAAKSATHLQDSVSIGNYANYSITSSQESVSIGEYSIASGSSFSTYIGNNISGNVPYSIIVGCYGLSYNASGKNAKMCIGGKYPLSSSLSSQNPGGTTIWNPSGETTSNGASTFITTPGIISASDVAWNKTAIYLVARNIVSLRTNMFQFSDRTLKENIRKTQYGIDKLRKLNIYQYNMKGSKAPNIGVIAQELMQIYPYAVSKFPDKINGETYYSVLPDWIIFSLAQSIKDIDNSANVTQKELTESFASITKLSLKVNSIENKLDNISKSNKNLQAQLREIDGIIGKMERK